MPRSWAIWSEKARSLLPYAIIPQLVSSQPSPESCTALRIASTPMRRVVRPELRENSVSPTPTTAYFPRRLLTAFVIASPLCPQTYPRLLSAI